MSSQTSTSANSDGSDHESEAITPGNTVEQLVEGAAHVLTKPRMRGWIHFFSAWLAIIAGATLVVGVVGRSSPRAGHATLVYAAAMVAMFAVSATYHRVHWTSAAARNLMKRLDHSMIFVFIAGSYTPFARLAMPQQTRGAGALDRVGRRAGRRFCSRCAGPSAPRWVGVPLYLLLGWVSALYYRDDPAQRRCGRDGAAGRRRRALQRRWDHVRAALARPVAQHVRLSRVLPRLSPRSRRSATTSRCGSRSSTSATTRGWCAERLQPCVSAADQ